jgi:hypothetical protein
MGRLCEAQRGRYGRWIQFVTIVDTIFAHFHFASRINFMERMVIASYWNDKTWNSLISDLNVDKRDEWTVKEHAMGVNRN